MAWDFGHHRTPYVPGMRISPPSPWAGYLPFFWLLYFALMTWLEWLKLRSKGNQGRRPKPLTIAIVSAAAFALYGAVILVLLAQLGQVPLPHWIPHLPGPPYRRLILLVVIVTIFLAALQGWLMWRNRAASNRYWPKRHSVPPAPDSDNAGAIPAHQSESGIGDSRQ